MRDLWKRVPRRLVAGIAAVVGVVIVVAVIARATGTTASSEVRRAVEADPSWLGYLPRNDAIPGFSVIGLEEGAVAGRRVDVRVPGADGVVSLCFAKYSTGLAKACPGAGRLGHIARDVDLPWVGLVGEVGATDWVTLLSTPVPDLDDLDYLDR